MLPSASNPSPNKAKLKDLQRFGFKSRQQSLENVNPFASEGNDRTAAGTLDGSSSKPMQRSLHDLTKDFSHVNLAEINRGNINTVREFINCSQKIRMKEINDKFHRLLARTDGTSTGATLKTNLKPYLVRVKAQEVVNKDQSFKKSPSKEANVKGKGFWRVEFLIFGKFIDLLRLEWIFKVLTKCEIDIKAAIWEIPLKNYFE